jgi:erythromycin esterase-like protein
VPKNVAAYAWHLAASADRITLLHKKQRGFSKTETQQNNKTIFTGGLIRDVGNRRPPTTSFMSHSDCKRTELDAWISREATDFSLESPETIDAAVDKVIAASGDCVELLGFGEAMHGSPEMLILRNRIFERLAGAHGYSAIAIESSFPRGTVTNDYVAGRGGLSYDEVQERGFSHGFGRLEANRQLVEWMRGYNSDSRNRTKLHFYGFDAPTEMTGADSPRQALHFVLDYLDAIDSSDAGGRRQCIDSLLGQDADWENPAAMMDPTKSIGLSAAASSLRVETEDLIGQLQMRRPELIGKSDEIYCAEAMHHASLARQLLAYHAVMARPSDRRFIELLGFRDAIMGDNLAHVVSQERGRGKVFAFAHNAHLQRGEAKWEFCGQVNRWWPAGAHAGCLLGPRYAVIGSAVGVSKTHGIGPPETGTLEAKVVGGSDSSRFIPTHKGEGLEDQELSALPTRSGGKMNQSYFPLTAQSLTDFDWLAVLSTIA